ncbi:MAG: dethiobiotin synthase [Corynebacterium sp.]|nr:dethiobiotin synthase [Corynebacterium sp.]
MIIFITGTNTDVGKTWATAAIAEEALKHGTVAIFKPAQTGEPEGHGDIYTVAQMVPGVEIIEGARYPEPLAPNIAARRAGMKQLVLEDVAKHIQKLDSEFDYVLVEGAGGVLVRIADDWTLADLAETVLTAADAMVVVASTKLGSLNAAELTTRELERRNIPLKAIIGGRVGPEPDFVEEETIQALPEVTGLPYCGSIPEGNWAGRKLDLTSVFGE